MFGLDFSDMDFIAIYRKKSDKLETSVDQIPFNILEKNFSPYDLDL